MKRSPLKRKTPLRRNKSGLSLGVARKSKRKNKYARRERAPESWWLFVKSLPCTIYSDGVPNASKGGIPVLALPCCGPIEANHIGVRIAGLGTKCLDREAVPMCSGHHRQWTDYSGLFAGLTNAERREYARIIVERTHERARQRGVEVPDA